jgi:hypothetical protein
MIYKYLSIAFILIVLFLVFKNKDGFDSAIRGVGALNIASIGALQGQPVNAFGVNVGGQSGYSYGGSGSGFGTGLGGLGGGGYGPYGRIAA